MLFLRYETYFYFIRHKIEVSEERRVNQKHVNILKAELKESRKKIHELENRLKTDSSSKAELAKRVQSVLKNQWMEALNVISGNDDLSKVFVIFFFFSKEFLYPMRFKVLFLIFQVPSAKLTFNILPILPFRLRPFFQFRFFKRSLVLVI